MIYQQKINTFFLRGKMYYTAVRLLPFLLTVCMSTFNVVGQRWGTMGGISHWFMLLWRKQEEELI